MPRLNQIWLWGINIWWQDFFWRGDGIKQIFGYWWEGTLGGNLAGERVVSQNISVI